ncbi:MAG TPA: DUF305 domain-containing protein [Dongiaceae bacterium]|jgi:uncharacterized protein (DUF305 family)
MKTFISTIAAILLAAASGAACRSAGGVPASQAAERPPEIIQPGAPGESSRVVTAAQASDLSKVQHTAADVKFMQGMIGHHAQAIEMVDLLNTRTASDDMKKLALRIQVSQEDEIKMMREWLERRGQEVPGEHAHHTGTLMPGMLTPEEMARLTAAKGPAFDRLFLEFMIKHHAGALIMVEQLFSSPGAGQESDIFAFASDVEADQRMEIERMAGMLKELPK